jgi:hypothetical protein
MLRNETVLYNLFLFDFDTKFHWYLICVYCFFILKITFTADNVIDQYNNVNNHNKTDHS